MLIFMGVRKGLKKLKGDKDKSASESSQTRSSKPSKLAGGTQEGAQRRPSTESVDENGAAMEAKRD
jgi:hypothetical protein